MKFFLKLFIASLSMAGGIIVALFAPFYTWLTYTLVILLPILFCIYFCSFFAKKGNFLHEKLSHVIFLVIIFSFALEVVFYLFYLTGLLEYFRDIESAKNWIQSFGTLSFLIFFIIQFLQVVILPIPAQISIIAGVLLFGPTQTFLISSSAVIVGSIVCFLIGKVCGNKVMYLLFKKETADHYRNLLSIRGRILLPIFFLLPIFPDDLLCFASGATSMKFNTFLIITSIFRPISIACICWVGSGKLIPFSSWGIPIWVVLIVLLVVATVLLLKYQVELENWIVKTFSKSKK